MSKFKKATSNIHRSSSYFFEDEQSEFDNSIRTNLYESAQRYQDIRTFEIGNFSNEEKLEYYSKEIKVQVKISQQAIFYIGEVLSEAKLICQECKMSFQTWIEENCGFSYETANNFMNVFKNCFAFRRLALQVPISILYNVSSPSFPDELRDFMFKSGILENSDNKRFKELVKKYKEGGLKAVENDINEIGRGWEIIRQTNYNFDVVENALRTLEALKDKIETRGGPKMNAVVEYERQLKAQHPESMTINERLYTTIIYAQMVLEDAINESKAELREFNETLKS